MTAERFTYRVWDVTDGERELLAMFNATDMSDALHRAVSLMTRQNTSGIEVERAGPAAPELDFGPVTRVDSRLKIALEQYDWAKGNA